MEQINQNFNYSPNNKKEQLIKIVFVSSIFIISLLIAFFINSKKNNNNISDYGSDRYKVSKEFSNILDCNISEDTLAYNRSHNRSSYETVGNCYAYFATQKNDISFCNQTINAFPATFTINLYGEPTKESTAFDKQAAVEHCIEGTSIRLAKIKNNCDFCDNLKTSSFGRLHKDSCLDNCSITARNSNACKKSNNTIKSCGSYFFSGKSQQNLYSIILVIIIFSLLTYFIPQTSQQKIIGANISLKKNVRNLVLISGIFVIYSLIALIYLKNIGSCRLMETCPSEANIFYLSIPLMFFVFFVFSIKYFIDIFKASEKMSISNKIFFVFIVLLWASIIFFNAIGKF
ncbi:MAG: hypothetical protein Q7U36_00335 [bacterium]|nr:hypothetical protein [bacterium]